MINYREILRLCALGHSKLSIYKCGKSLMQHNSEVLAKAKQLHITWLSSGSSDVQLLCTASINLTSAIDLDSYENTINCKETM